MDELFTMIGKLYMEAHRLQQYVEILQSQIKDLENKNLQSSSAPSKKSQDGGGP